MFAHRRTIGECRKAGLGLITFATMCVLALPATSQTLTAGQVCGQVGTSVWFDVTLNPQGKSIAATQNDISFDSVNTPIGTCTIADGLNQSLSLNFLPSGCSGT